MAPTPGGRGHAVTGGMRLDGVEVKVTLGSGQVEDAVRALRLPGDQRPWRIHFCEDVTRGVSAGAPLLARGVVLRARDKPGGEDDTTVKLRPCRRSQLTRRWLAEEGGRTDDGEPWEFTLEADWSGARRVLAASATCDRAGGLVADVGGGRRPVADLFVAEQREFLRDCSEFAVDLGTLTALPAVTATRWRSVAAAPPGLEVRAERWTVDDLDFLELSVAVDLAEARAQQEALTGFVRARGFEPDPAAESKTARVVEHLVTRAAEAP